MSGMPVDPKTDPAAAQHMARAEAARAAAAKAEEARRQQGGR